MFIKRYIEPNRLKNKIVLYKDTSCPLLLMPSLNIMALASTASDEVMIFHGQADDATLLFIIYKSLKENKRILNICFL